jgi:hypothetical protein
MVAAPEDARTRPQHVVLRRLRYTSSRHYGLGEAEGEGETEGEAEGEGETEGEAEGEAEGVGEGVVVGDGEAVRSVVSGPFEGMSVVVAVGSVRSVVRFRGSYGPLSTADNVIPTTTAAIATTGASTATRGTRTNGRTHPSKKYQKSMATTASTATDSHHGYPKTNVGCQLLRPAYRRQPVRFIEHASPPVLAILRWISGKRLSDTEDRGPRPLWRPSSVLQAADDVPAEVLSLHRGIPPLIGVRHGVRDGDGVRRGR